MLFKEKGKNAEAWQNQLPTPDTLTPYGALHKPLATTLQLLPAPGTESGQGIQDGDGDCHGFTCLPRQKFSGSREGSRLGCCEESSQEESK